MPDLMDFRDCWASVSPMSKQSNTDTRVEICRGRERIATSVFQMPEFSCSSEYSVQRFCMPCPLLAVRPEGANSSVEEESTRRVVD